MLLSKRAVIASVGMSITDMVKPGTVTPYALVTKEDTVVEDGQTKCTLLVSLLYHFIIAIPRFILVRENSGEA